MTFPVTALSADCPKILAAARAYVKNVTSYDSGYRKISYPNGDVPARTGVCSDVMVRSLRAVDLDLQKLVHEDLSRNKHAYPNRWGLKTADPNIDHRRVPNLFAYLERNGNPRPLTRDAKDFQPCDIVAWDLGRGVSHIGLVTDKKSPEGIPLVIHHFGGGEGLPSEDNVLFRWKMTGHFAP